MAYVGVITFLLGEYQCDTLSKQEVNCCSGYKMAAAFILAGVIFLYREVEADQQERDKCCSIVPLGVTDNKTENGEESSLGKHFPRFQCQEKYLRNELLWRFLFSHLCTYSQLFSFASLPASSSPFQGTAEHWYDQGCFLH